MKSLGRNNFNIRCGNRAIVWRPIVFALIVVIIILFVQFLFPRIFASTFSYFFSSLWSGKNSVVSDMTPRAQLVQENKDLAQQLALYREEASSSKALIDENNELKSLLGRPVDLEETLIHCFHQSKLLSWRLPLDTKPTVVPDPYFLALVAHAVSYRRQRNFCLTKAMKKNMKKLKQKYEEIKIV